MIGSCKRALRTGALFICLQLFSFPPAFADCNDWRPTREVGPLVAIDGDTLHAGDGERIRLIGVNTPERARRGRPAEPLAEAARENLARLVLGGDRFALREGADPRDRHGRTLAHVRTRSGEDLSARQIGAGLGFHVIVGRNRDQTACLRRLEDAARRTGRGVWGEPYFAPVPAAEVDASHAGFRRLRGRVRQVSETGAAWWLDLDGPVVLRVAKERGVLSEWRGRHLEVQGWLIDRHRRGRTLKQGYARFLMRIDDPLGIRWEEQDLEH